MSPQPRDVDLSTRSHTDRRFVWSELRDELTERYGAAPSAEIETEVLAIFEARPRLVIAEGKRVADDLANGKVRRGWPILRSRLAGATSALEAVVVDGTERSRCVEAAERWLVAAGAHLDRWPEVEAALFEDPSFADRGQTLRPWRADEELRARLFDRWCDLRAGMEELEAETLERARRWKDDHERVRRALAAVRAST